MPKLKLTGRAILILAVFAAVAVIVFLLRMKFANEVHAVSITGAVISQDSDPRKRTPISNAVITLSSARLKASTRSNAAGFFHLSLLPGIREGETVNLRVEALEHQTVTLDEQPQDRLYVIRLSPQAAPASAADTASEEATKPTVVSEVRLRYSVREHQTVNVGSIAKEFDVINTGNVPCRGVRPCSPDGKWKAAEVSLSLDASEGNEFHNLRVSCIAGPCPFTDVRPKDLPKGGRQVTITARDWSDTTSFLVEAEIVRVSQSEFVRTSYPFINGRSMTFALPPASEGVSIEAELDGTDILFPLGPNLILSWATCTAEESTGGNSIYRCELKPTYTFAGT